MRKILNLLSMVFTVAFIGIASFHSAAQGLTAKTNTYSLNLKKESIPNTGPLPHVIWIRPQLEFTSTPENKVDIKAKVVANGGIQDIKLVVGDSKNGTILSTKRIDTKQQLKEYSIDLTLTLPDGTNFLSIECTTPQGMVISDKRQVSVGAEAMESLVSLDRHDIALMFATDKYDNWTDLVNPINDARAISRELSEKYGFQVDLVENPSVEEIWEKLREYNERKFGPQDQLLIFFAGHGHFDESFGEGYVVARNSLSNDLSRTTYLSHNRLRGVINNIACQHILLTMDVCFGGTLDPVIARSRGIEQNELTSVQVLARKWSHQTRKYLTSGGKEYVSDGIVDRHSPFAGQLIESLRSFGGDDGILTLAELQASMEKLKQLPRFGSFGSDEPLSDFVFVRKQ